MPFQNNFCTFSSFKSALTLGWFLLNHFVAMCFLIERFLQKIAYLVFYMIIQSTWKHHCEILSSRILFFKRRDSQSSDGRRVQFPWNIVMKKIINVGTVNNIFNNQISVSYTHLTLPTIYSV